MAWSESTEKKKRALAQTLADRRRQEPSPGRKQHNGSLNKTLPSVFKPGMQLEESTIFIPAQSPVALSKTPLTPVVPSTPKSSTRFSRAGSTKPRSAVDVTSSSSVVDYLDNMKLVKSKIVEAKNDPRLSSSSDASFDILKGQISNGERSLKYTVSDVMGIFYSVHFVVTSSQQSWTVFVPSNELISELLRVWGKKHLIYLRKFSSWIVASIKIEFSLSKIVKAELIQSTLRDYIITELFVVANRSASLIQQMIRNFLDRRNRVKQALQQEKVTRGLQLAKERVKEFNAHERTVAELTAQAEAARKAEKIAKLKEQQAAPKRVRRQYYYASTASASNRATNDNVITDSPTQSVYRGNGQGFPQGDSVASNNSNPPAVKQANSAAGVLNSAVNSILYGNLSPEELVKTQRLEEEVLNLKAEMENQRLQYFYGRGMSKLVVPDGEDGGDEELQQTTTPRNKGTRASASGPANPPAASSSNTNTNNSAALNARAQREVKALRNDIENLQKVLGDLQFELFEQRRRATEAEKKLLDDLVKTRVEAEASAARVATELRSQALEEMKSQLAQREAHTAKVIQRQRHHEQQKEQELRKEIEDKYAELAEKLKQETAAAINQQEALKAQLQELKDNNKGGRMITREESPRAPPLRREPPSPNKFKSMKQPRSIDASSGAQHGNLGKSLHSVVGGGARPRPTIHGTPLIGVESASKSAKRPARSTKNLTISRQRIGLESSSEDDDDDEEDSESVKQRLAYLEAQRQAQFLAQQQRPPPRPRTWLEWLLRQKVPEPEPIAAIVVPPAPNRRMRSSLDMPSVMEGGPHDDDLPMGMAGARTIRRVSRRKKKNAAEQAKKNSAAKKIQSFVRFRLERRKIALNQQLRHLRKLALLSLLPNSTDKEILSCALRTAVELNHLVLMNKVVDRAATLLEVYDYADEEVPVDCALLCNTLAHFYADQDLAQKGLDLIYGLLKLRPPLFLAADVIPELAHTLSLLLDFYCNDDDQEDQADAPPSCAMGTLILKTIFRLTKRSKDCRDPLSSPAMCVHIRKGLERCYKDIADRDMLFLFLRLIIVLTADCPAAQLRMGEGLVCECVLMSFLHNFNYNFHEPTLTLHLRALRNMIANDCRYNQLILGRGMYPQLLVNAAILLRQLPSLLVDLLQLFAAILANCEANQVVYQSAGAVELLMDMLTLHADRAPVVTVCMRCLSHVVLTSPTAIAKLTAARRQLQTDIVKRLQLLSEQAVIPSVQEEARKAVRRVELAVRQGRPVTAVAAVWVPKEALVVDPDAPPMDCGCLHGSMDEDFGDDDLDGLELEEEDSYGEDEENIAEAADSPDGAEVERQAEETAPDANEAAHEDGEVDGDEARDRVHDLPVNNSADRPFLPSDGGEPIASPAPALRSTRSIHSARDLLNSFHFFAS